MSSIGPGRIRFGVVGLGRTWATRFRPAVQRLRDRFAVSAVLDPVAARAEAEARSLRCTGSTGLAALVERPDVDAVALLAPQWFGLHPVELAARAGKPVYLGVPLPDDLDELARLDALIRPSGVPIFWESPLRHDPATTALRQWFAELSAPVNVAGLQIEVRSFDRTTPSALFAQDHPGTLFDDPGQAAVDWCRFMLGGEVTQVWCGVDEPDSNRPVQRIQLRCGLARRVVIRLTRHPSPATDSGELPASIALATTAQGGAIARWPGDIRWNAGSGDVPVPISPAPPIGEVFLDQFARLFDGREHSAATWDDALAAARVFAAIRRSAVEGTWIDLDGQSVPDALAPGPTS